MLGTVIIYGNFVFDIVDKLISTDFNDLFCRTVFDAIKSTFEAGLNVDITTVYSGIKSLGARAACVSQIDLMKLTLESTTPSFIDSYINIIIKNSLHRRLIDTSINFFISANSSLIDPKATIKMARDSLDEIENLHKSIESDFIYEIAKSEIEEIKKAYQTFLETGKPVVRGIKIGYPEIDAKFMGLKSGELHILAARPGCGKTAFALNILKKVAIDDASKALFFSLEMSNEQIVRRLFSICYSVPAWRMLTGVLLQKHLDSLNSSIDLEKSIISMVDSTGVDVYDIRREAKKNKHSRGLDIIFIDYLQLMKSGSGRYENRHVEVSEITRSLKLLAKELDVPIVCLSQLSRNVSDSERPSLRDLKESGSIEQDADAVMLMYKTVPVPLAKPMPDLVKGLCMNVDIAKNRNGPTGTIQLTLDPEFFTFESVCKEQSASLQTEGLGS